MEEILEAQMRNAADLGERSLASVPWCCLEEVAKQGCLVAESAIENIASNAMQHHLLKRASQLLIEIRVEGLIITTNEVFVSEDFRCRLMSICH